MTNSLNGKEPAMVNLPFLWRVPDVWANQLWLNCVHNEYESYILIDVKEASNEVKSLFDNLMNKDFIFLQLQSLYNVVLKERKSVIIFDEVQNCPLARQAIKYLVKDGR